MSIFSPQIIIKRLLVARPLSLSNFASSRCLAKGGKSSSLDDFVPKKLSSEDRKAEQDKFFGWLEKKGLSVETLDVNSVFKLFDIEPKYKININKLRREMLKLQKEAHPDRFGSATLTSLGSAEKLSSFINEFYGILRDPYLRGKFLLGIMTDKNEIQIEKELDKLQLDEKFLVQMIELREKIAASANDQFARSKISHQLTSEINQLIDEISNDFESKSYEAVKMKLGKMKFLVNCQNAVQDTGPTTPGLGW